LCRCTHRCRGDTTRFCVTTSRWLRLACTTACHLTAAAPGDIPPPSPQRAYAGAAAATATATYAHRPNAHRAHAHHACRCHACMWRAGACQPTCTPRHAAPGASPPRLLYATVAYCCNYLLLTYFPCNTVYGALPGLVSSPYACSRGRLEEWSWEEDCPSHYTHGRGGRRW